MAFRVEILPPLPPRGRHERRDSRFSLPSPAAAPSDPVEHRRRQLEKAEVRLRAAAARAGHTLNTAGDLEQLVERVARSPGTVSADVRSMVRAYVEARTRWQKAVALRGGGP